MKPVDVSDVDFENDVLKSRVPVLVDFWAEWCSPCKALAVKLDEIAEQYSGRLIIAKVDIDQSKESPAKYGVRGVPTLILFKEGQICEQMVGNHPKESIQALLDKHL